MIRVVGIKKAPKKRDSGSSNINKHDDYDIDESQDSQSNVEANPDEIEDLNISLN